MNWTNLEIKKLRELYPGASPQKLAQELPRHSANSIRATANKLGLRKTVEFGGQRDWMAIVRQHNPAFNFT